MGITHATTASGTDAGTGEIHKAQWNADHVVTGIGMLGATFYVPGADTFVNHTNTSSSDLDATNVIVTFTAPASGNVVVRAGLRAANTGGGLTLYLGIRESSSLVTEEAIVTQFSGSNVEQYFTNHKITGLTPGSSHTYKLGYRCSGNGFNHYTGPTYGPTWITVEATP